MEFTINKSDLLQALTSPYENGASPSDPLLLMVEARGEMLYVSLTAKQRQLRAKIREEGSGVIPVNKLLEEVKATVESEVTVKSENNRAMAARDAIAVASAEPAAEPAAPPSEPGKLCPKCGKMEMVRKSRSLRQRIMGSQPYRCRRCGKEKIVHRKRGILPVMVLLLLVGGGAFLYLRSDLLSPIFGQNNNSNQDTADALARARSASGGQLSSFEQMMIRKPKSTMDNATVIRLWRANVGPTVILQMIRNATPDFDLSANAVIELKEAGVDQNVIMAMINAAYTSR